MMWPFPAPKPTPLVIKGNVLGEEGDRVEGVQDLENADLRYRQWPHADLSGMCLDGANCEGINLLGARLVKASFSRCNLQSTELSFSNATQASFREANLDYGDEQHTRYSSREFVKPSSRSVANT